LLSDPKDRDFILGVLVLARSGKLFEFEISFETRCEIIPPSLRTPDLPNSHPIIHNMHNNGNRRP